MPQRKIPTIVGLLLVVLAVFIFSLAFDRVTPLFSRASPTLTPQHVTLSNISDTTFTISWLTVVPTTGTVIIEGSGIGTLYDERDEQNTLNQSKPTLGSYTLHEVIVRNTKPQTTYHFSILSAGSLFTNGLNPYTVTTGSTIPGIGINLNPAYGSVTLPNGQPASDAIVYLTPVGGQTLSTLVTPSGSWVIPLHLARTTTLSSYIAVADRINESITIRTASGESTAETDTLNDSPVPVMTIGKTYDFRHLQAKDSDQLAEAAPSVLGATTQTVSITQPLESSHLTSNLPLFEGTGIPGQQVLVVIGITDVQSGVTNVGTDGVWRYTPTLPLSVGKQSVTITTTDANGKAVALTNTFEVLKSGTQVLGVSTPSATLEPTPTEVATTSSTLAGQPLPTTGDDTPTIILIAAGSILFISGLVVLFI